jgi:hypothetical protein
LRFSLPPPHILADSKRLNLYFWQQREEWHSQALRIETDPQLRIWHEEKLANAISKLSENP